MIEGWVGKSLRSMKTENRLPLALLLLRLSVFLVMFVWTVDKFVEPQRPDRTIIFLTGRRGFWPRAISNTPDICGYIRHAVREFDLGRLRESFWRRRTSTSIAWTLWQSVTTALQP